MHPFILTLSAPRDICNVTPLSDKKRHKTFVTSSQKGLRIGLGEAGNKVSEMFCWQHCLRLLNIGNTSSYPYTHSNAQESHCSCCYSKEAWWFAGSNDNKCLALKGLTKNLSWSDVSQSITRKWEKNSRCHFVKTGTNCLPAYLTGQGNQYTWIWLLTWCIHASWYFLHLSPSGTSAWSCIR